MDENGIASQGSEIVERADMHVANDLHCGKKLEFVQKTPIRLLLAMLHARTL